MTRLQFRRGGLGARRPPLGLDEGARRDAKACTILLRGGSKDVLNEVSFLPVLG